MGGLSGLQVNCTANTLVVLHLWWCLLAQTQHLFQVCVLAVQNAADKKTQVWSDLPSCARLRGATRWDLVCCESQHLFFQWTADSSCSFVFSLSKLQLKTGDLDPRLFSRLRHLQKLDLSDNLLDKFPNSLTLPDLRVLNCNNNKLEDVTALKQFPLLEELTYENNVYLTVSYLPSLEAEH